MPKWDATEGHSSTKVGRPGADRRSDMAGRRPDQGSEEADSGPAGRPACPVIGPETRVGRGVLVSEGPYSRPCLTNRCTPPRKGSGTVRRRALAVVANEVVAQVPPQVLTHFPVRHAREGSRFGQLQSLQEGERGSPVPVHGFACSVRSDQARRDNAKSLALQSVEFNGPDEMLVRWEKTELGALSGTGETIVVGYLDQPGTALYRRVVDEKK